MAFWNEYASWADITYGTPWPGPSSGYSEEQWNTMYNGGGGSSKPSATATPTKNDEPVRNQREKYIISSSDSQIATMLKQGIVTMDEIQRLLPESRIAKVLDNPVTAKEMEQKFSIPKQDIDSFESPQNVLAGRSTVSGEPMGQGEPVSGAGGPASTAQRSTVASSSSRASGSGGGTASSSSATAAAQPAIAGDYVWNNGRPYIAYQGQKYMLPQGAQEDDPRVTALLQRLGSGNTSGAVVGNTKNDLLLRGGTDLSKAMVLNGQQWVASALQPEQGPDGKWYIPGQATPFASESAAKAAIPLIDAGAAVTSRLGNSPLAKAAGQGGYSQMLDPNKALFPLIGMDQQIAAGATKGPQVGDILGTISNNTGNFQDITLGGIGAGGGLTAYGNQMDPYAGFTGQTANGDSIGMSSILGNSMHDTLYWLNQMSGIPIEMVAKMVKTPEQALQFQQAVETLRGQGMMPDLASLYAQNEPTQYVNGVRIPYEGASGGSQLKWGPANGGADNTPFDRALAGFADYALGSPDLTYLPTPGYGSTQIGNTAYANSGVDEWGNPLYADGGQFWADEPIVGVGALTGRRRFMLGEEPDGMGGFKPERLTIEPEDVVMGRESGYAPMGMKMRKFATGGVIYGGTKGWQPSGQMEEEQPLTYQSPVGINQGSAVNFVRLPAYSTTGQPVAASFENMSPAQQEPFTNQGGAMPNQRISGPLTAQPVGTQLYGGMTLPVYDQLNPQTFDNLSPEMQKVTGYRMVPMNVGGTPALVRVPEYGNIPSPLPREQQDAIKVAFLTNLLGNNGVRGDLVAPGMHNITSREAALAALYDLDPKAALLYASQGNGGSNTPWGQEPGSGYGGRWGDRSVMNEAERTRFYDAWDTPNRNRAGLPGATVLPIDRVQNWTGEGEAPYQRFRGQVEQGFRLPNDYEVGGPFYNRGNQNQGGYGGRWGNNDGWGRTGYRKQRPWERRPMGAPLGAGVM